jgi:hypothetical protein
LTIITDIIILFVEVFIGWRQLERIAAPAAAKYVVTHPEASYIPINNFERNNYDARKKAVPFQTG